MKVTGQIPPGGVGLMQQQLKFASLVWMNWKACEDHVIASILHEWPNTWDD